MIAPAGTGYQQLHLELKNNFKYEKSYIFFFIFFGTIFIFIFINGFIKSRKEYGSKYNFTIDEIKSDAKGNLIFFDSVGNEYSFASFTFNKHDKLGISVGDKVFKDYKSKNMIFSRETEDKYSVYYIQKPNGMVPFSFYSY
ncbi:hypothetical protein AM493_08985 [Flavobacterium akiainvivens]|uniref:Uncharacterized protein n=2 Tax=Flavobacterium akiainvivens TaxID=1202724 RepID=A0A0M9VI16_9FLAO|nr:hypothetical protein AM493_08985 [Flavobacterium akiainvivens]